MITDLHAHYPMHLDPGFRGNLCALRHTRKENLRFRDHLRALAVNFASQFANYPSLFSRPRVCIPKMVAGEVGVAYSVLLSFFDEIDRHPDPATEYVDDLIRQAGLVERSLRGKPAVVAHNPRELRPVPGSVVLVHCVEGGYHLLGQGDGDVARAVDRLADCGVAYITLAHLIYRGIATGANAFPFLTDKSFKRLCKQPERGGLTERGKEAIEAMVRRHVLIDISHMSELAIDETFAVLDDLDQRREVPVLATHVGYRCGEQLYNLTDTTITRIAERDGVIGLIMAQHQIWDGLEPRHGQRVRRWFKGFDDTVAKLCTHIDAIHGVTGDYTHIGIGTDLDGFIKPTLKGVRDMRNMKTLEAALRKKYGDVNAELMCSRNALRPLQTYWRGAP